MGHCKDCKHWDGPEEHVFWDEKAKVEYTKIMGYCELASSKEGDPRYPDTLFVAMDGEPHAAHLLTAPDFGCVQWEAVPNDD